MAPVPPDRHLLRAKDLIDARYAEPLDVDALARAAHASPAHFTRPFRRAFGETPTEYRAARPPAGSLAPLPTCVLMAWTRPRGRAVSEKTGVAAAV
jgi:AraC-like DNA-binding protein